MSDVQLTMIDGRDALFGLVVREGSTPGSVGVEMFGNGLSRAAAIETLRRVADSLSAEAHPDD